MRDGLNEQRTKRAEVQGHIFRGTRVRGIPWPRRLKIASDSLHAAFVGMPYNAVLNVSGGRSPYGWSIVDGALPSGLGFNGADGTISGTPATIAEGASKFTVQVMDADKSSVSRDFVLDVRKPLAISPSIIVSPQPGTGRWSAEFSATGGTPPYKWGLAPGSAWPAGLGPDPAAGGPTTMKVSGTPLSTGTTRFTLQAVDQEGQEAHADFYVTVRSRSFRRPGQPKMAGLLIQARPLSWWRQRLEGLRHFSSWLLASLGIGVPTLGTIWVVIYAFSTAGPHWTYLGTATLLSLAAFLSGCLTGFLFGIPRVVSSGELRQEKATSTAPRYTPSTNLAEVSDWLTKLLLGAGLVQLTRLGAPIAGLIDHVAAGLYAPPASRQTAEVMAGALLVGYTIVGLLDGYVVTTVWYQKQIVNG